MGVKSNGFMEDSLLEDLMKLLLSLASKWGDKFDTKALQVVQLKGGHTNEVYQISWPRSTSMEDVTRTVLVRIYGEGVEIFFNRGDEIRTFECMSMHGQGPQLLGLFPKGRIEEFIHARTLLAGDLRDPEISALVAAKLREFHNLDMPGPNNVVLWDRLKNWLGHAKSLCSSEHAKEFCLDVLEEEICELEKVLPRDNQEIGFCHNDLQHRNIMIDEETKSIIIIDYEYASYNPVAYDLANHFCEMVANVTYPSLEECQRFVYIYLSSAGNQTSDTEVELLVADAEKYTLPNYLFWGLWGLISAYVNNIGFDYIDYARQRFQQYWLRKPQFLGTSKAPL